MLTAALQSSPASLSARIAFVVMLCAASTACTRHDRAVPGSAGSEPVSLAKSQRDSPVEAHSVRFTDVTAEAGLAGFRHRTGAYGKKLFPETMGAGAGFIDYDGDDWSDIILVGGGQWPGHEDDGFEALWLYRNDRDGTFSLQTDVAGLSGVDAYGFGVAVADYDNDGDDDFLLTTLGENRLFRNDGGRFTEVGRRAGIANVSEWSTAAVFFDPDLDGWLDLYVGNFVVWTAETDLWCTLNGTDKHYCTPQLYEGISGRFYRNRGDGTFEDRTAAAGFAGMPGKTLGAVELDFNKDAWPDLAVANDQERDLLFVNNGDGTFSERGLKSGIAFDENGAARSGMGIDAGVVDESGETTLFVGNFSGEMMSVFRHTSNGLFVDRSAASRIGRPSLLTLTFGLFLFDADLDGDLDVFAANGDVREDIERIVDGLSYRQRPQLYLNDGSGVFTELSAESGPLAQALVARGAAYADYDGDGDLDVLVVENGGPAYLWRNESPNASVRIALEGRRSNRSAIGTNLVGHAGGRRTYCRVRSGASYLSQSEYAATFGLGDLKQLDSLRIEWPSGTTESITSIPAGTEWVVREGSGAYQVQRAPGLARGAGLSP